MSDPGKGKDSGGSLASGSFGAADFEIDLPVNVALPSVDFSVGTPSVSLGTPCGYPLGTIPAAAFPVTLSLTAIAALLGIHIPFFETPTVCPEIVEAALVAAVLAAKK